MKVSNQIIRLAGVVIFIFLWWLIKALFFSKNNYLPNPFETFINCFYLFTERNLFQDFLATLTLLSIGFFLAAFSAIPVGLLLGFFRKGYSTFEVVIDFFRSIPVTALFPLFILFFGISKETIIAMITVSCFWVILINTAYGVIYTNNSYLKVLDSFGATTLQKFREVIFFEALPFLFVGLRVGISFGLIVVVVSEMFIGSQYGLGQRVYQSYETNRIIDVYSLTIVIGLLGYFLNNGFLMLEKKLVHWKGQTETS